MPEMSGLQLQDELLRRGCTLPLVFVTAHGDVPLAVEAMRKGASNFLEKPFSDDALIDSLRAALANARNRSVGAVLRRVPRQAQSARTPGARPGSRQQAEQDHRRHPRHQHQDRRTARANMMNKLGVRSLPELMKVALGHG